MEPREKRVNEFINELKQEWKLMWVSRFDDKVRAESIADKTYDRLFMERGTVLFATRDCRPFEFRDILEKYMSSYEIDFVVTNPARGGVRKFIRDYITPANKSMDKSGRAALAEKDAFKKRKVKEGGKGWLHLSMYPSKTE